MKKCFLALAGVSFVFGVSFGAEDHAATMAQGEKVYQQACKTCHAPEVATALKAAAVHDKAAWAKRFADAEAIAKANPTQYKTAMDVLVHSVKNGKNAMIAGGMCVDNTQPDKKCTDADYRAAILFMSSPKP